MTQTIERFNETYLTLARDGNLWRATLSEALAQILETVARALEVRRVGIWLLDERGMRLTTHRVFDSMGGGEEVPVVLHRARYPAYFAALDAGRVIDACDAADDERTGELAETYLRPRGIGALLDASLRTDARITGVLCIEHIGGQRQWGGREIAFAVSIADLVSRLLIYDEVRQSEARFRALLAHMPSVAYRCGLDSDRSVEFISDGITGLTGARPDAFPHRHAPGLMAIVHPDDREMVEAGIRDSETGDRRGDSERRQTDPDAFDLTYRVLHRDGSVRWVQDTGRVVRDAGDRVVCVDGVLRDITREREAAERLRNITAFQQAILDGASHAIIYTNSAGMILSFNAGAERMFGYSAREVIWKHGPDLFCDPEELAGIRQDIAVRLGVSYHPNLSTMLAGATMPLQMERETTYVRKDGTSFPALLTLTSQHDVTGQLSGFVAIVADISDRKRAEALAVREQDLILHIMKGTSGATGDEFFDTLTLELVEALGVQVAFVAEYIPGEDPVARTVGYAMGGEVRPSQTFRIAGAAAERIIADGSYYCPEDVWTRFPRNRWLTEEGISGYLGARLDATDGSPLGILVVADTGPFANPTLADHLVRIFAVRAAAELERIRAEQELLRSRTELLERNALLRLLNRLSERLNEMLDERVIALETVALLEESNIAPHVGLFLLDKDQHTLSLVRSTSAAEDTRFFSCDFPLARTAAAETFRTGNIFFSEDISTGMAHVPERREELLSVGIRATLIIPMMYRGIPLGTIGLGYHTPPSLGPETKEHYRALGQTVALALANARHLTDLDFQAHHDALTRLPNRVVMHRELAGLAQQTFNGSEVAALLLLDLDRFKEINDTLGHDMGDRLLMQIGPRLDEHIRENGALLCRLGGDEFAVLLRRVPEEADAYYFAHRILAELKRPFPIDDTRARDACMNLEIGGSIGIAFYPAHGETSHDLLRSADVAMYQAKRSGMGVFVYDRMMDRHSPQRLAIMNDLRHAIDAGEMSLRYQPRLDIRSNTIVGFEALVRWQHPRFGLLMPDQFIPLAEMGDTIHALTDHVLELAVRDLVAWRETVGEEALPWSVSVNLSARDLIDDRVARTIEVLLEAYRLEPWRLELELTETALMQDPATAAHVLSRIAELGVRISIDDFGTGYSSLSYLRRLPIYALKIARDFIQDMLNNEADTIIVRSTIQLGHNLGLIVVAESVEDQATLDYLCTLGCDQAQGNHIRPPVEAKDVIG